MGQGTLNVSLTTDRDEPSTHPSLLARVQSGQGDGWEMLVQVYGPVVYRWIRRCGAQPADAADVMQETFLAVAHSIRRFDAESPQRSFRGWLWTIARNKLRDRGRRERQANLIDGSAAVRMIDQQTLDTFDSAQASSEDPPTGADQDMSLARRQTLEILRQSFEPRSWRMFWETAVEDREAADVAAEMNVSKWAVYKAKARVLQRLRDELDGLEDGREDGLEDGREGGPEVGPADQADS